MLCAQLMRDLFALVSFFLSHCKEMSKLFYMPDGKVSNPGAIYNI